MSNEMTAMELLYKLECALMESGISAGEVGLFDEDSLCEYVETWIGDRSYSLAADACELLRAAEQNRAKGEVEEPVFIIDFDGRTAIAYTAEQLLENLPDEVNKDLAESLVSETTYVVQVYSVSRSNTPSAPSIEQEFADEAEAREFFRRCVEEMPRDYACEKNTAGRLFDRRYRLVAELYAANEHSMFDDVLEHEEYAYADYLKDKENDEENED